MILISQGGTVILYSTYSYMEFETSVTYTERKWISFFSYAQYLISGYSLLFIQTLIIVSYLILFEKYNLCYYMWNIIWFPSIFLKQTCFWWKFRAQMFKCTYLLYKMFLLSTSLQKNIIDYCILNACWKDIIRKISGSV